MRFRKKSAKNISSPYGVWKYFDEIDFDRFRERFVLKATHGPIEYLCGR
jgi:hypothetical protein